MSDPSEDAPLIQVRGVSKAYRSEVETVWAAREIDLDAYPGEFICIFGASGSGKSTLLNLLAGLDLADQGEIQIGGTTVTEADERQRAELRLRTVGVIFQDHRLIEEFTAAENVGLPLEACGASGAAARAEAERLLAQVGLNGLEDRLPRNLSGGQRQRVGIARALSADRRILLGDEPTGSLDSAATLEVFGIIRALCDEGTLAIVCSHDLRCRDFADTLYEMVDGRLEAVTSTRVARS